MRVTLDETTVGQLGAVTVGCGNFWERAFEDDDGNALSAMSARLAPFDGDDVTVRVGSRVEIGGRTWMVDTIDKTEGDNGSISLVDESDES